MAPAESSAGGFWERPMRPVKVGGDPPIAPGRSTDPKAKAPADPKRLGGKVPVELGDIYVSICIYIYNIYIYHSIFISLSNIYIYLPICLSIYILII